MTIPAFQFWRLRVTSIEAGDLLKIDSMAFLGRSGGDNIATGGTALSDAGDASGAFTGGSAWRVGFGGATDGYLAIGTDNDQGRSNATTIIRDAATQTAVARVSATGQTFRECEKVAFSPDGAYLATIEDNSQINIYDTTSWAKTAVWTGGGSSSLMRIAWSNDGRYLASAGGFYESSVSVFDRQNSWTRTTHAYITAADSGVYQLAWSPDDSQLAIADRYSRGIVGGPTGNIVVFDTSDWSWQIITKGSGSTDPSSSYFTGVAFSPDGQTIAATCYRANGNTVVFSSASTLTQTSFIDRSGPTSAGEDLYYNNAGTHIAFSLNTDLSAELVEVWDVRGTPSKETLSNQPVNAVWAYDLSWSADGAYIAVAVSPTVGTVDVIALIDTSTWAYVPIPDVLDGLGSQLTVYSVNYSPTFGAGTWIGYKFAYPVTPTHIDITASGDSRPRSGVIEYSPDGRTWYALQTIAFS